MIRERHEHEVRVCCRFDTFVLQIKPVCIQKKAKCGRRLLASGWVACVVNSTRDHIHLYASGHALKHFHGQATRPPPLNRRVPRFTLLTSPPYPPPAPAPAASSKVRSASERSTTHRSRSDRQPLDLPATGAAKPRYNSSSRSHSLSHDKETNPPARSQQASESTAEAAGVRARIFFLSLWWWIQ